jgi:predicted transposase YdaD
MLLTEWNLEDFGAVRKKEGREERAEEITKNALKEDLPVEVIQKITGLDMETIKRLAAQ